MKLRLSEDLALPIDAVTQTFLVVGKRGSGKTNTCVRLAEQFHHAKLPFVVVDPVDSWWGLKASKDGRGPGLDVYVFGGKHADLPLEPTGGALVADVVTEHRISAVLSVKHFSGRERARFVADFADRLFRKNAGEPIHLFLEEAHEVAPQNPFKGDEEMLGRVTRIWKLGRSSGLGGSAITQRPASLSKNITTQAEILIVHRMLGPQDVAAIREWFKYHGESDEILSTLSELKTGEAWIWAPDFPEEKPIGLRRIRILERETFDSSATPKAGQRVRDPKDLAPVDVAAITSKMQDTIERAKAEDPRELRKQIAALKLELRKSNEREAAPLVKFERVEVPVFTEVMVRANAALVERVEKIGQQQIAALTEVRNALERVPRLAADHYIQKQHATGPPARVTGSAGAPRVTKAPATSSFATSSEGAKREAGNGKERHEGSLIDTQHRILDTVAMLDARGLAANRVSVARWMGIHPNGGRYLTDLARLREVGLLEPRGMVLTPLGAARAQAMETGQKAALEAASTKDGSRGQVLKMVIEAERALTRQELADLLGIHPNGGRFLTNLARLREMGLLPERGEIRATEGVFR